MRLSLLLFLAGCPLTKSTGETGDTAAADTGSSGDTGGVPGPTGPARVDPVCGPDDGLGLRFTVGLADETCDAAWADTGHMRISLWNQPSGTLAAGTYSFDSSTGSAWYDGDGSGTEEYGSAGKVVIRSWAADSVEGWYSVTLDSGVVVEGNFDGAYCEGAPVCG